MNFKDLTIKNEYRTSNDNIVRDFYMPVLKETVRYNRAVGFFSSSALIEISKGLECIINRNGKINLIVSPRLSDDDILEINNGYERRREIIEKKIIDSFGNPSGLYERKKMGLLSHLIEHGFLDIRIAFMKKNNKIGMFHEKMGILEDGEGNVIAFSGSLNESKTAFTFNFESIDVFCNWKGNESKERVESKELSFEKMWTNTENEVEIIEFPKVIIEDLKKMRMEFDIEEITRYKLSEDESYISEVGEFTQNVEPALKANIPQTPREIKLREYQNEAVLSWKNSNYTGIFDMATGTGKTYTCLAALVEIFNEKHRIFSVIVCPYQHLVEQWVDDLKSFNIFPIIGYSEYRDYKQKLSDAIIDYNVEAVDYVCFICTNATFRSEFVKNQVKKINDGFLLVVDEAHNFGAEKLSFSLPPNANYRLALSATIERHNDNYGTKLIFDYFGEKCIDYPIDRAIAEKMLTPYKYYPVITHFENDELEEYENLSKEIARHIVERNGVKILDEIGKLICIKRARLVASAREKPKALLEKIDAYKRKHGLLVYCGATNMISNIDDQEEVRQIDIISKTLFDVFGIRSSQFTSNENKSQRSKIITSFVDNDIQAIVAIKCLDEGVNIPAIKTAFILASSTNPKEFIQRRGRVLRLFHDKNFAEIYDFIVLPRKLTEARNLVHTEMNFDKKLLSREISRVREFSRLSLNPSSSDSVINSITDIYGIDFEKTNIETWEED